MDEIALVVAIVYGLPVKSYALVVVGVRERIWLENLKIRPVWEEDVLSDCLGGQICVVGPGIVASGAKAEPLWKDESIQYRRWGKRSLTPLEETVISLADHFFPKTSTLKDSSSSFQI